MSLSGKYVAEFGRWLKRGCLACVCRTCEKGTKMSNEEQSPDGKILSMVHNRAVSPTPALDKIERYWNVVRSNRLVPSRSEIDPRGLEGVLGNTFILERITGGLARFRIAGSHISEITGLELRQMPVSALFLPDSREILSDALIATFEDPAAIRMRLESKSGFGREKLTGEMILLPLRSDQGQIDRILGGIALDGKIGRRPRRLEIMGQSRQSLIGYAGPETIEKQVRTTKVPAFRPSASAPVAPRKGDTMATEAPSLGGSHLKLVVDNS